MHTETLEITPALAEQWLSRNQQNRNLSKDKVRKYVAEMIAGSWQLTHQGIAFDTAGRLLDGQHRLQAVVVSGVTIQAVVTWGASRDTFPVIDTGIIRYASQFIPGPHSNAKAGALRYLISADGTVAGSSFYSRAGNRVVIDAYDRWQTELDLFAPYANKAYRAAKIAAPPHIALVCLASRTEHVDKLGLWFEGIIDGAELTSSDPRLHLRNRFLRDNRLLNGGNGRLLSWISVVKAWNAFASGQSMALLRARVDEAAPKILGYKCP